MSRVNLIKISLLLTSLIFFSCSQKNAELGGKPTDTAKSYLKTHYGSNCRLCHLKDKPETLINRFTHSIIQAKNCGECHKSAGGTWADGYYDHSVKIACKTCHESNMPTQMVARFKHANIGNRDCGECHSKPGGEWNDGKYDHKNNQGSCQTCHESNRPKSIVNSFLHSFIKDDCITCHDKPGAEWAGGNYTHVPAPDQCIVCHDSKRPQGPIRGFTHTATKECNSCHKQPGISWTRATYDHDDVTQCGECHSSQKPVGLVNKFNHIKVSGKDCSSCHHKPGETWSDGVYGHTPVPLECALCHQGQQPQVGKLIHSQLNLNSQDCFSCHTKTGLTWTGAKYPHTSSIVSCAECHEAQRPQILIQGFTHPLVKDCKTCHLQPGVTWADGKFDHSEVTTCQQCHQSKMPVGVVKNFDHKSIGSADCSQCHKKAGVAWDDGVFGHTPAPNSIMNCAQCHQGQAPQTGRMPHTQANIGIQDCYKCHTKPGEVWAGAKYVHPSTLTTCTQCHSTQRPTGTVNRGFNHQNSCGDCHWEYHDSYDCSSCHDKPGVSWTVNPIELKPASICLTCHYTEESPQDNGGPHLGPYAASTPATLTMDNVSNSTSQTPAFTWAASTAGTYPIAYYEAAIFNADSYAIVKDWTNIGFGPTVAMSGLNLPACRSYRVGVRAVDNTGLKSPYVNSNVFWVITATCGGVTYKYTGDDQTFLVPPGISSVTISSWGGGGGGSSGGNSAGVGASGAKSTVAVTPGSRLTIKVGQGGQIGKGGWPNGSPPPLYNWIGGGGGSSSVLDGATKLIEAKGGNGMPDYGYGGAGGGSNLGATLYNNGGTLPGNNVSPCSPVSCGQGTLRTGTNGMVEIKW